MFLKKKIILLQSSAIIKNIFKIVLNVAIRFCSPPQESPNKMYFPQLEMAEVNHSALYLLTLKKK